MSDAANRRLNPLVELSMARIKEFVREPEAMFWVFVFPVLLALALGIAFRHQPEAGLPVAVVSSFAGAEKLVHDLQKQLGSRFEVKAEVLEEQNWTRAWMDHYDAMQFGERLWVVPLHMEPPQPDAVNLRLDPGLAFGTGTHPTTSLCLKWLDRNIGSQDTLLDYGCGSGILAIAACLLGVNRADGVDIDPQALTATNNNSEINAVGDKVTTWLPEDYQQAHGDSQYDVVVANILSGPLAELAPTLARHCKTAGEIVLSGILKEQAEDVLEAYRQYFTMDEPAQEEDWVLLHGVKN